MRVPSLRTLYHRSSSLALAFTNLTSTSRAPTNSSLSLARLFPLSYTVPPPVFQRPFSISRSLPSIPLVGSLFSTSGDKNKDKMGSNASSNSGGNYPVQKSESEWQAVLSPEQFRVVREKGTEAPFTGEYDKHMPQQGVYKCVACEAPLYTAQHKFKSGCGWPAYFDSIPGAVERHTDRSFGMARTEITCARCGGHLGHVFKGEGYPTPTDERHCVNSVSLRFTAEEAGKKE